MKGGKNERWKGVREERRKGVQKERRTDGNEDRRKGGRSRALWRSFTGSTPDLWVTNTTNQICIAY